MTAPLSQRLRHQLARFLVVGAAGFTVDMAVLAFLLYGLDYAAEVGGLLGSRVLSFLAAIAVTFLLNARYTFGASVRRAKLTRYLFVQGLGAAINLGTYTVLVLGPLNRPLIAMALGAALATVSNFLLVRRFVYFWR
ncbi:MAG: GtrA family protein [Gammaproteobacteria bacterium]|nr:GtrA family protein [Gammaproteobacteria bacterium]